jgi:hypothetical protein
VPHVAIGDQLSPEEETELQREQARVQLADEEAAVVKIEAQLAGIKETLAAKRAEIKRLRAVLEG